LLHLVADDEGAQSCYQRALELGLPAPRVIPYQAELLFKQRQFAKVQELMRRLEDQQVMPSSAPLHPVLECLMSSLPKAARADIALLLEGTFPYVSGGVSSWVHQILQAYPQHSFAIVFIGSRREDYGDFRYELPPNVVHFEEHFLYGHASGKLRPTPRRGDPEVMSKLQQLLQALERRDESPAGRAEVLAAMRAVAWSCCRAAACRRKIFCTVNICGS
jgi:hypothetical protein